MYTVEVLVGDDLQSTEICTSLAEAWLAMRQITQVNHMGGTLSGLRNVPLDPGLEAEMQRAIKDRGRWLFVAEKLSVTIKPAS